MASAEPPYRRLSWDDFATSWAGVNPFGQTGYCFGSERGELLYTDGFGRPITVVVPFARSGEAVNGVAAFGDFLAVSTRADITLSKQLNSRVTIPAGAHGVESAAGRFLAPCGPGGVIVVNPARDATTWSVTGTAGRPAPLVVYQVAVVRRDGAPVMLGCAARLRGVATVRLEHGRPVGPIHVVGDSGIDVVDVCTVALPNLGTALLAVSRDGHLIVSDLNPARRRTVAVRLAQLRGAVYKVLARRNRVIVLTSQGLHILLDGVAALAEAAEGRPSVARGHFLPIEAVDVSHGHGNQLLVVMDDDSVRVYDTADIERMDDATLDQAEPLDLPWQESDSVQDVSESLVALA